MSFSLDFTLSAYHFFASSYLVQKLGQAISGLTQLFSRLVRPSADAAPLNERVSPQLRSEIADIHDAFIPDISENIAAFLDLTDVSELAFLHQLFEFDEHMAIKTQLEDAKSLSYKQIKDYESSLGSLEAVFHECKNIKHLDLSNSSIGNEELTSLLAACPKIVSIDLSNCRQLTVEGLASLVAKCPHLTSLNLANWKSLTDEGLEIVTTGCPHLTSLNLTGCNLITKAGIEKLSSLRQLNSLNLTNWTQLTDDTLEVLIANCPKLTSLVLANCSELTDWGMAEIATNLRKLTSLDLSNCNKITDEGLKALAVLDQITSLNLSDCLAITGKGLGVLTAGLSRLASLSLSGCYKLTDDELFSLSVCENLTSLDLSFCPIIKDLSHTISDRFPKLTHLRLHKCSLLQKTERQKLEANPQIEIDYTRGGA